MGKIQMDAEPRTIFQVSMPLAMANQLNRLAAAYGKSRSELIRQAVKRAYLGVVEPVGQGGQDSAPTAGASSEAR